MTSPLVPPSRSPTRRAFWRAFWRAGWVRVAIGIWLAIHGIVVAGTPVVDALAGHADSVVAHWEDAQDTSCPPVHDPATCQLCQQITSGVGGEEPGRIAPLQPLRVAAVPADGDGIGASEAALRGAPDPRGPPAV